MSQKRKPVVTVWCLPANLSEGELRQIFIEVVATFKSQPGLDIQSESDLVVLFPSDRMSYGLGSEIVITVEGVEFSLQSEEEVGVDGPISASVNEIIDCLKKELLITGHSELAERLVEVFIARFPAASIQCTVRRGDPYQGFASSD